jgi:hypothetical protein
MTGALIVVFVVAAGQAQAAGAAPQAAAAAKPAAANPDELLEGVRKGDLAAVKAALDAGVPVDHPFRYDRTALSFAAARGKLDVVRLLLERGADPNKKDTYYGMAPITLAVEDGHVDVVRLLLERGAAPSPGLLSAAARKGDTAMVKVALEKTKPTADDLATALADAEDEHKDEVVAQLKAAGAVPPPAPDFAVDQAALASYAGAYRDERGNEIRFEVREGKLVCANCAPGGMVLGALDAVTFRQPARPLPKVVFALVDGKPKSFTLDFGQRQNSYQRVAEETPKEKP